MNKGAESMYGYKASEVINQPETDFLHSILNKEVLTEIISQVCRSGHWQGESRQQRKDGSYINVLSSLTPIHQNNGELTGFVSINQDISSQKLYEKQLKQFNKELSLKVIEKTNEIRQNLERMTDGFIAFDKDWRFTMLNEQSEQMLMQWRVRNIWKWKSILNHSADGSSKVFIHQRMESPLF